MIWTLVGQFLDFSNNPQFWAFEKIESKNKLVPDICKFRIEKSSIQSFPKLSKNHPNTSSN
jgi:hypothetical protein